MILQRELIRPPLALCLDDGIIVFAETIPGKLVQRSNLQFGLPRREYRAQQCKVKLIQLERMLHGAIESDKPSSYQQGGSLPEANANQVFRALLDTEYTQERFGSDLRTTNCVRPGASTAS